MTDFSKWDRFDADSAEVEVERKVNSLYWHDHDMGSNYFMLRVVLNCCTTPQLLVVFSDDVDNLYSRYGISFSSYHRS